jgi:protease-4
VKKRKGVFLAKHRVLRFFGILFGIVLVLIFMSAVAAWIVVRRGPNVPQHATLILRVGGTLVETPPTDVIGQVTGGARAQTVRGYVETLHRAKSDPRIEAILLVPTHLELPYWGKVQELRDAILDFRKSGKRINAYLEDAGDREYYLATACDRIFMIPSASLDVKGIASYELFLRGTLDKIGAKADFEHIGQYKTAPNQLTEHGFTPAHREMSESLNRDMFEQLVRAIAEGRKKRVEDVRALIDQGPFLPAAALQAGLVDKLAYEDQLDDLGAVSKNATVQGEDYARARFRPAGINRGPRIAVLYISGVITGGDGGFDPLNGEVVGSKALVEAIRSLRGDNSIRAIVLRIDSPGGSSTASDVIWRELSVTRDQKPARPMVASMSDLAASGGYYVAVAAPTIVAQPATLTGSIGIFGGKVVTGGTYEKLGMNIESLSIGRNAEMESPVRPFSDSERAKLREELEEFYGQFVAKVAASRKMPVPRVEELARGRVWTGLQAKSNGLVDALGGLDEAVALAKKRAGIAPETEVELVNYPPRKTLFELLAEQISGSGSQRDMDAEMQMISGLFGGGDAHALGMLTAPMRLFHRGEPLALMPFTFVR